jgi:hypothetical protein
MISYFVRYRGAAANPSFAERYEAQHTRILRRFPAIRSLIVHRPIPWNDPFPVTAGGTFLLAQMQFDSIGDLDTALSSRTRAEAREDFRLFPPFTGEVTHEAMQGRIIF